MNNSRRTAIIARGIGLWAQVQDQPADSYNDAHKDWRRWENHYPEFVEFVKAEQFALFDRVNAAF